jgi:hypothetical protein
MLLIDESEEVTEIMVELPLSAERLDDWYAEDS